MHGKEIILTASQAQTIPYYCNNLLEYPHMQHPFALGTKPDAVLLCVNYHDETQYIKNTIYTITGLTGAAVIALIMYPITYSNSWSDIYGIPSYHISANEFKSKASYLETEFHIPVYLLGDKHHAKDICQLIVDFF